MKKDYPYNLSKEEAIRRIENVYHAQYDPTRPNFDAYDQLLACEVIAETELSFKLDSDNVSAIVNGSGNDTYKLNVNKELKIHKFEVITKLKSCTSKQSPKEIAALLQQLFVDCDTKDGHWLYIAQNWTPRAINRVINQMIKSHKEGWETIQKPAAYFTQVLRYRKMRKSRRRTR